MGEVDQAEQVKGRNAGGRPREPGTVSAIETRGEAGLTPAQAASLTAQMHALEDRQGIRDTVRHEAALVLTVVEVIVRHIETKAAAGVALDDIGMLRLLPTYVNTAGRLLAQLDSLAPQGSAHDAEVKRVQALLSAAPKEADDG